MVNDISKTLISSSPSPPWPTPTSPNPNFPHQLFAPLSGNLELLMEFIVFGGKKFIKKIADKIVFWGWLLKNTREFYSIFLYRKIGRFSPEILEFSPI
jgi:hypothetical protein